VGPTAIADLFLRRDPGDRRRLLGGRLLGPSARPQYRRDDIPGLDGDQPDDERPVPGRQIKPAEVKKAFDNHDHCCRNHHGNPEDASQEDAREKMRVGVFGSAYSYAGSSPRITSEALGCDINPLGRGDGMGYVGGALNLGAISPALPNSKALSGTGNSVNNGILQDCTWCCYNNTSPYTRCATLYPLSSHKCIFNGVPAEHLCEATCYAYYGAAPGNIATCQQSLEVCNWWCARGAYGDYTSCVSCCHSEFSNCYSQRQRASCFAANSGRLLQWGLCGINCDSGFISSHFLGRASCATCGANGSGLRVSGNGCVGCGGIASKAPKEVKDCDAVVGGLPNFRVGGEPFDRLVDNSMSLACSCLENWNIQPGAKSQKLLDKYNCLHKNLCARKNGAYTAHVQYDGCCCNQWMGGQFIRKTPGHNDCCPLARAFNCRDYAVDPETAKVVICPTLIDSLAGFGANLANVRCGLADVLIHEFAHSCGFNHPDEAGTGELSTLDVEQALMHCCACKVQAGWYLEF